MFRLVVAIIKFYHSTHNSRGGVFDVEISASNMRHVNCIE